MQTAKVVLKKQYEFLKKQKALNKELNDKKLDKELESYNEPNPKQKDPSRNDRNRGGI